MADLPDIDEAGSRARWDKFTLTKASTATVNDIIARDGVTCYTFRKGRLR